MAAKKPEVKQGTNRGHRVYWLHCPKCGTTGPEHVSKAGANVDKKNHQCDG